MSELEAADETSMLKTHFENSLQHLRKRIDVSPDEEKWLKLISAMQRSATKYMIQWLKS